MTSVRGPPPLHLRPASPVDRDFLVATREAAFRPYVEPIWGWDDAHQRADADREFRELPLRIVEVDGSPIGYLRVLHRDDHDFLDEVALLPAWQGRGIGSSLVCDAMTIAADRGVPLRLSVLMDNPARRLYERLGFRVTAVEHPRLKMEWTPSR